MRKADVVLAVVFYVLNVFDCFITLDACHRWGIQTWEANPLMAAVIREGDWVFILLKVGGGALITLWFISKDFGSRVNRLLIVASGVYALLTVWNIFNYYALSTVRL